MWAGLARGMEGWMDGGLDWRGDWKSGLAFWVAFVDMIPTCALVMYCQSPLCIAVLNE